ncbi:bacteriohemerythrin [Caenispirillum salinarum]|uniref:bacteriohemerythrin n=1 Tax=Caenispirillum salinarum TaxID=859058 RepID=UPI00384BA03B
MGNQGARNIAWSNDLEIGIPVIDADHKVLVSLLNQVFDTVGDNEEKATLGSVLNSLVEYTEYHFVREEKLQEVAGYSGLEAHKARHRDLERQVMEIRSRFEEDPDSVHGGEVLDFLRDWLVDHIEKRDFDYRDACLASPDAIAAAARIRFGESDADREAQEHDEARAPAVDWASLKVLVVEDNRNFQVIIQTILKSLGVRDIHLAGNGQEGLDDLAERAPDLVLCDWRMETMDGLEFAAQARERGSQARIIMMSGYSDGEVREKALVAGVDAFLEKPITARGFLEAATKVLSAA